MHHYDLFTAPAVKPPSPPAPHRTAPTTELASPNPSAANRWQARYKTPEGKMVTRAFPDRPNATAWLQGKPGGSLNQIRSQAGT
ncbi:hypothetical protein BJF83_22375 [Nocardiopsis sp. CNR-923]|uniref:hypothetical protein n=1 Tax=Nocardiopsis sp. CNR-923 TaxID=1904965 RepID=UPI000965447D|nr:hypothetical protein [Nocardiopsis sp. CNR-923]OLT25830.1 hypothetical protein BJF83_22375 [Nocardiopsis sp. CNR-923]